MENLKMILDAINNTNNNITEMRETFTNKFDTLQTEIQNNYKEFSENVTCVKVMKEKLNNTIDKLDEHITNETDDNKSCSKITQHYEQNHKGLILKILILCITISTALTGIAISIYTLISRLH